MVTTVVRQSWPQATVSVIGRCCASTIGKLARPSGLRTPAPLSSPDRRRTVTPPAEAAPEKPTRRQSRSSPDPTVSTRQSTRASAASKTAHRHRPSRRSLSPARSHRGCAGSSPSPPQARSRRGAAPPGPARPKIDSDIVVEIARRPAQLHDARIPAQDMAVQGRHMRPEQPRDIGVEGLVGEEVLRGRVSSATSASSSATSRATMPSRWLAGHHLRNQCPSASRRSSSTEPGTSRHHSVRSSPTRPAAVRPPQQPLRHDRIHRECATTSPRGEVGEGDLRAPARSSIAHDNTAPLTSRTATNGVGAAGGPVLHKPESATSLIRSPATST